MTVESNDDIYEKIISFLPSALVEWSVLLLLLFIPLYPKLPLIDISFSWTYIRVEDILAALSFVVLTYVLLRRRASLRNFLFWPIVVFWIVGLISTLIALATLGSVDNWVTFKPHLIVLHYLRRIEYLGVFFVGFVGARNYFSLKRVIAVLIFGLVGVILYGMGQRFAHFPAFLTMNEEFSKGTPIALQPGTRISSTFGGHYDLAGYLVFMLPLVVALIFTTKNMVYRLLYGVLFLSGFFVLLLTSSRISFAAVFVSVGVLMLLVIKQKRMLLLAVIGALLFTFVLGRSTIVDRLAKTIRVKQVVVEKANGKVLEIPTVDKDWGGLPESDRVILLPFLPVESTGAAHVVTKYEKGSAADPHVGNDLGVSVNSVEVPQTDTKEIMQSEKREIIEEVRVVQGKFERHYALIFDISFTTRIDGEWPKTLTAFRKHPVFGQGYSTVTAAVDSSYIRALGEVGIVGFISFFFILLLFISRAIPFVLTISNDRLSRMFVAGVVAGVCGLLINAVLIDIFEASKVAFVLWTVLGVAVKVIEGKVLRGKVLEGLS